MTQSYICIDIGTGSIKAVEKDYNGRILSSGSLKRLDKPFHSSIQPLDEEDAASCLRTLLKRMEKRADLAVMSLPAFSVFTALAPAPDPKYIPAAPSIFKMEAVRLSNGQFFLVAIPREIIMKYQNI